MELKNSGNFQMPVYSIFAQATDLELCKLMFGLVTILYAQIHIL